ncbi:MAG TPA: diaminopimelate epimerase [Pilimelia sp.]|nr:diaminopimelate epimerase [Pilimelia sp.]
MQFTKGHGTGNDFVLLPDPDGQLDLTPALVAALCDRRFGIGGDGVLRVVRAAKHPDGADQAGEAEWFMDYWNADGSFAEMCGNGARVFARYLVESGLADPPGGALTIATRAGAVRARVTGAEVAVDLGAPRLAGHGTASVGALSLTGVAVDCGNPHLVCALPAGADLATLDLSHSPGYEPAIFPNGVNVEFTTPGEATVPGADVHVRMRVFERGSGETMSCGTGACAVAAVALAGAGRATGVVAVDLPGGRLTVSIDPPTCWLSGPTALVATGAITLTTP